MTGYTTTRRFRVDGHEVDVDVLRDLLDGASDSAAVKVKVDPGGSGAAAQFDRGSVTFEVEVVS